ncbi:MAG TPA: TIM44-like domain-containing protein [Stellaceae bacterium]|nr:TIM44-like domain-containing protein [Stellaceae bacterium]
MGSRGSQTYNSNGAAPIQRSITPQTNPSAPYGTAPGYGGGFGTRHPFLTGLAGGFLGSWIGSLLFPHFGMGYGVGGMFGSIFTWLILIGAIWFVFRMFRDQSLGMPFSGGGMMGSGGLYTSGYSGMSPMSAGYSAYSQPRLATIGVAQSDYDEFESLLKSVQKAWSDGDLGALRQYTTPEMLSYFAEQLAENESQGVANKVADVALIKGEVREAWDEGRMHYATALMQWRARDYTVRSGGNAREGEIIVGGDPQNSVDASEMWTFARSPGGRWLLSAIQQV